MAKKINLSEEEIKRLYLEKRKSTYEIGELMGCSGRHIINCLKKMGTNRRNTSESRIGIKHKHPYTLEQRKARSETVKKSYVTNPSLRELRSKNMKRVIKLEKENGQYEKRIEKLVSSLNKGFKSGRIKVWNKGLTKESNPIVKKYAEKKIGIKREDLREKNLVNNPMKNPEVREKNRKKQKQNWSDPNSIFHTDEYRTKHIKSTLKGLLKRPTSYEKKIAELCIEFSLPFVYTGNGTFLIGFKNPDFINETKKIAIEVYHDYFKIRGFGSCEEYEKQRSEYFAKRGWKTIFIRTEEIMDKNWKEVCLNKIKSLLTYEKIKI